MPTNIQWPPIGGTTFPIPTSGETNWPVLTNFLVALQNAQGTTSQKVSTRIAASSPVTVSSSLDCVVGVDLTIPGPTTLNLPPIVPGQWFCITDRGGDAGTNPITIVPDGVQTIAGLANIQLNQNGASLIIAGDPTGNWLIIAQAAGEGTGGGISRSAIDAATPNWVVINNGAGLLSQEQYLSAIRGGLGVDASAFTGFLKFTAGVASATGILASELPTGIDAAKIGSGTVSNTEFGFLDGVTSGIQSQIGANSSAIATKADGAATAIALAAKVAGPASAVDSQIALFDGTTGKLIKAATFDQITPSQTGQNGKILGTNGTTAAWQTPAASSPLTTKGDLYGFSTLNARIPVGTDNQVLVADSAQALGLKWATASGGLAGVEQITDLNPAVKNTMYEYGTLAAPRSLTLPTGTTAFVIGVLGSASLTNTLSVAGVNGDSEVYRYPNFNAVYYRAEGSSVVQVQRQAATLIGPATATSEGAVKGGTIPSNLGVPIAYPYIGYSQLVTVNTVTNAAATGLGLSLASITLQPGKYSVDALAIFFRNNATLTNEISVDILVGAAGGIFGYSALALYPTSATNSNTPVNLNGVIVEVTSATVIALRMSASYSAGTPQWRGSLSAKLIG